ncbi:DsbA family oxidoreductase [sulfur-oxidizing endosymbiont of Gigantopelta aegis]|uniref:DsbA family oxidoreductase n=1 Tax=sulfur-oxidizing endosymbiont of Gigantopelta aegis TaxID=2794934 RepID=UPI0018DB1AC7|nr:hypothetical protein [sulfur-oxidizing endosymbiont of Gigantopelta aegis]
MLQLQKKFPHIEVHPEIGLKNLPYSSASCHLFLKSIQLLEQCGEIASSDPQTSLMGQADWLVRLAYFRDALDISNNTQLMRIAEQLNIPRSPIEKLLNNGEGMAALSSCTTNDKQKLIEGSPSFVFNEGRQRLYGNIGYHIIAANIKALLEVPENKPSWY